MSRRRYVSTEISTDKTINQLARTSDFAALFYTWLIPHAEDDATFDADPEELLMKVCPGRRDKEITDIQAVLDLLLEMGLIERCADARRLRFPPKSFYKYQSYISEARRGAPEPAQDVDEMEPTAQISAEQRTVAQNATSFSSSLSSSLSVTDTSASAESASVSEVLNHYRNLIHPNAKLTDQSRKKVLARLKEFSVEDIKVGMEHFSQNGFSMDNNASRGLAWWCHSEDRVLGYINMTPKPSAHSPATRASPDDGRLPDAADVIADMHRRAELLVAP